MKLFAVSMLVLLIACGHAPLKHDGPVLAPKAQAPDTDTIPSTEPPPFILKFLTDAASAKVEAKCAEAQGKKACIPSFTYRGVVDVTNTDALEAFLESWEKAGVKAFVVEIDSPGGRVDQAYRLNQILKDAEQIAPVHCVANGRAMSAAFAMLQSCTVRASTPVSMMMTHNPYSMSGMEILTYYTLQSMQEEMLAHSMNFALMIAPRMKMSIEAYLDKIKGANWEFNATGAMKYNALDKIVPTFKIYLNQLRNG